MNSKLFGASLLTACVLLASASQANASGYTVTFLENPLWRSWAKGINNAGQVVGVSGGLKYGVQIPVESDGGGHATIWNGTTPTDLGTLLGGHTSRATGINDSGQVVGYSDYDGSPFSTHATIWNGTTPTDLGTLGGAL